MTTPGVHAYVPPPSPAVIVYSLAIQSDGKILVGGRLVGGRVIGHAGSNFFVRLNESGSLDMEFGPNTPFPGIVTVQTDGKILVGYERNYPDPDELVRLNLDGSVDKTFNTEPYLHNITAIAVQPDGKILISGISNTERVQSNSIIMRLNKDGSIDETFKHVVAMNEAFNKFSVIRNIVIQPDGDILIDGTFGNLNGQARVNIGRLHNDGTLDMAFNPAGKNDLFCMAIQPDGKILVSGMYMHDSITSYPPVGRLNPDGSLDASFDPVSLDGATAVDVQPDGKIVVGGFSYISRLNPDGVEDMTFKTYINTNVNVLVIQKDGKVLIGGNIQYLETQKGYQDEDVFGLVRLNTDGSVDLTFHPWTDTLYNSIDSSSTITDSYFDH